MCTTRVTLAHGVTENCMILEIARRKSARADDRRDDDDAPRRALTASRFSGCSKPGAPRGAGAYTVAIELGAGSASELYGTDARPLTACTCSRPYKRRASAMLVRILTIGLCFTRAPIVSSITPARCTRNGATDFQAPGSKCPSKPCADLGGDGSTGHGFGAADAQACCQLCADYKGTEECKYAVFQAAADKNRNCFLKAAPAEAVAGVGNVGMELLPQSTGWGSTLLVVLLLFIASYVGGGLVLGKRASGKIGLVAHPHYHKWVDLYSLVIDGGSSVRSASVLSVSAKRRPGRDLGDGYHSTVETEPLRPTHRDRKKTAATKEKKHKAATMNGGRRSKEQQAKQSGASAIAPQAAQQSVEAESRSKASAAGDGGRWVRVPN